MLSDRLAKLKSLLKDPTFLTKSRKIMSNVGRLLLCAGSLIFMVAKAPEFHAYYLRAKVGSRAYRIKVEPDNGGGGTGFQVTAPSGTNYIVTNSHVCKYIQEHDSAANAQTVVVVDDAGNWIRRRIIANSDQSDLCLVEGAPGIDGLSLGSEPKVGDHVTIVGHPHLRPTTLSSGEVIGSEDTQLLDYIMSVKDNLLLAFMLPTKDGKCDLPMNEIKTVPVPLNDGGGEVQLCLVNITGVYLTSVVIYSGNSGSPMVDFYGRVVGVAFAADDRDNYASVISLSDLKTFLAKY